MATIEIKVPDIGDFKDVGVIEVLVKPGDTIAAEQSLITVESDKASMEIPSSAAGVGGRDRHRARMGGGRCGRLRRRGRGRRARGRRRRRG